MVEVFSEVRRVLKDNGTVWLNLGDSYLSDGKKEMSVKIGSGIQADQRAKNENYKDTTPSRNARYYKNTNLKRKDLVGIPWRVAFALQADGWYLRQDIIWAKPNPMPESVTDRCTKAHEYIFLLSKNAKYYYNAEAIKEPFVDNRMGNPMGGGQYATDAFKLLGTQHGLAKGKWNEDGEIIGRNKRSVWTVTTKPYKEAHFATFPIALIEPCILAGTDKGDTILDPFFGAGTTGVAAYKHDRKFVGIELNPEYVEIAAKRIEAEASQLKLF